MVRFRVKTPDTKVRVEEKDSGSGKREKQNAEFTALSTRTSWTIKDPRACYVSARELDRGFTRGTHHLMSTNGLPLCVSNAPCIDDFYGSFRVLPGTHDLVDYLPLKHLPLRAILCKNCAALSAHTKPNERGRFRRFIDPHKKSLIVVEKGFICNCKKRVGPGEQAFYHWTDNHMECVSCGDTNKDIAA